MTHIEDGGHEREQSVEMTAAYAAQRGVSARAGKRRANTTGVRAAHAVLVSGSAKW